VQIILAMAPTHDVEFEAALVGAGTLPAPMDRTLRHQRTISVHDILVSGRRDGRMRAATGRALAEGGLNREAAGAALN
jgi:hypothetical protein